MTIVLNGEKYITKPCNVTSVDHLLISNRHVRDARHGPKSWLGLVTTESKFRQVRKDRCCWFSYIAFNQDSNRSDTIRN